MGKTKALVIGSGLRVTEDGFASNHHFLPPTDGNGFKFLDGDYTIEMYATIISAKHPLMLGTVNVMLAQEQAALQDKNIGVLFTWGPEAQRYHVHISLGPVPITTPAAILTLPLLLSS